MTPPRGAGRADAASTRDSQRSRVYDAQHLVQRLLDRSADHPVVEVAGSRITLPVERHFGAVADVQAYLDRVLALGWVRSTWPRAALPVGVRERAGHTQAHYEFAGATIALPPYRAGSAWALRELVVLHELAHHLTGPGPAHHGEEFLACYLELVDALIGTEAAFLLRVTLMDVGARVG
ncbi:TIGR04338 family metallohydrolase [Nakamurella sp. YIM 132087]|uniref:TIGR04338 family metallohydrolase n=1 Tax=Nakamurella alba TaxID=2665158 RepID=A0A7K1FI78_9ACTN|nr:TIGR04338 family metallohydrolase [Nakamurella alba]MTD13822.1 TIGR04338 family metallohydrolase [Nakamurella alba]